MRKFALIALTAFLGAAVAAGGPAAGAPGEVPTVTVHDEYIVEGIPGQKQLKVPLTLTARASDVVQVGWTTIAGTASAGTDYVGATGTTSFTSGQTRRDITLQLVGDDIAETDERFTVRLTGVTGGATIADDTAEVLVIDDEGTSGPGEPPRNCSDNYPYTTDSYSASLGYCVFAVRTNADDDGDRWAAAQVGGADCDDANPAVYPGAVEVSGDGIDNNCDGITDGGVRNCSDNNPYTNDKYNKRAGRCTHSLVLTADRDADGSVAAQVGGPDCNDATPAVRPGVAEVPGNSVDDNCDGLVDGGGPVPSASDGVTIIPGSPLYCPAGDTCIQFIVRCEGTPPARGYLATGAPTAQTRGVVVLFTGARGQNYWAVEDETVVDDIQAEGFEVDRVAWPDGWAELAQGPTGADIAGCRPSTITKWVHDNRYVPLGLSGPVGECGFCVGGNSGGATQAAYGLAEYGLETIVDAAVLTSGPSLAALADGCLGVPEFTFDDSTRGQVDLSYGVPSGGPCFSRDPSYEATWREDSLNDGADDLVHPKTRLEFIHGGLDLTTTPAGANIYIDRLRAAGSPMVEKTIYPNAGHGLKPMLSDPDARAGIIAAFAKRMP